MSSSMLELFSNFFILHKKEFNHNHNHIFYLSDDSIENICYKAMDNWQNLKDVYILYDDTARANVFLDYVLFHYAKQNTKKSISDLKTINHYLIFETI